MDGRTIPATKSVASWSVQQSCDFPAESFVKQDVAVQIDPPEGDQLITNLDLSTLR